MRLRINHTVLSRYRSGYRAYQRDYQPQGVRAGNDHHRDHPLQAKAKSLPGRARLARVPKAGRQGDDGEPEYRPIRQFLVLICGLRLRTMLTTFDR